MSDTTFDRTALGFEAGALLDVLLGRVDDTGRAQIPTTDLVKGSKLTQGGLTRARTELTRQGLLRTETGYSANGLRGANVYVLDLALLGPVSVSDSQGESGQNWTDKPTDVVSPANLPVRGSSKEENQVRAGWWSRVLRRS